MMDKWNVKGAHCSISAVRSNKVGGHTITCMDTEDMVLNENKY